MYKICTRLWCRPDGYVIQFLRIMKILIVLMTAFLMQVSASTFAQKITLDEKKAGLFGILQKINQQSGVNFLVDVELLGKASPVSIRVKDAELLDVLDALFKGQPLVYQVDGKNVIVKPRAPSLLDRLIDRFAVIDIRGRVLDEAGYALPGATVKVKGLNKSTTTNAKGEFFLTGVDENALLEISFIGYVAQEVKAAADLKSIRMVVADTKLEEVTVNAGYYTVKDRERTGSIAKVTAKDIESQPVTNVLSAVQGRMAGVSITQSSGVPGGGYDIQIRGRNSLRTRSNSEIDGNLPLYVVDGVPISSGIISKYGGGVLPEASINPLNSISPADIASIEILKDADATAIYGSRGANGVVLVTTKKANKGKLSLNLNSSYGWSQAISNLKMMNTEQYLSVRKQAFTNDKITSYPATAYDMNGTWDADRYTDWWKELLGKRAKFSNNQLSLSGGSGNTTFLLSVGHNEQTTVFAENFKYKNTTLSGNASHSSADRKFQFNMSNLFSSATNNVPEIDNTRNALLLSPNAPALYDENGKLNWQNNSFNNPLAAYENSYTNETLQFMNNMSADYAVLPDLRLKINGGFNYQTIEEWSFKPNTAFNPSSGVTSAYSQAYKGNQSRFSFIVEPQVNWTFKRDRHQVDVLVGGAFQRDKGEKSALQGYGFESNVLIRNIGAAQTKMISDQISTEYRYAALFGRLNYQLDGKYILNITGRRDGSSRFGPNNKFANFGAVGAAWLFSEEKLLKDLEWLSFGKLRGSYGSSGSDNIGDYQYHDTFITSTSIYNSVTGLIPSKLYNPDFSWEKTTKLESALELGLFNNRLNLSAAWYKNRSSNQLVGYQLPAITGFTSVLANLNATVQNTGWEFEAKGDLFSLEAFNWSAGFNISFPRNKLISFPGLAGSTYANSYVIGLPVSISKLYQLEGIDPLTGLYAFTDFNADGKISSPDDRQIIKNLGQQFFGGFSNDLNYKNWNLSFLLQFVKQQGRNYNYIMSSPGLTNNLPEVALNVWSAQNPTGFYMPYHSSASPSHVLFQSSEAIVSDASFIRLKNVQLMYGIPLKKTLFKELKLYFQGQNLYTWTNYFGVDPEFTSIGFLPPLRTFSFGLRVGL